MKAKKIGFFVGCLIELVLVVIIFRNAHWSVAYVCTAFLITERLKQWVKINSSVEKFMDMIKDMTISKP